MKSIPAAAIPSGFGSGTFAVAPHVNVHQDVTGGAPYAPDRIEAVAVAQRPNVPAHGAQVVGVRDGVAFGAFAHPDGIGFYPLLVAAPAVPRAGAMAPAPPAPFAPVQPIIEANVPVRNPHPRDAAPPPAPQSYEMDPRFHDDRYLIEVMSSAR